MKSSYFSSIIQKYTCIFYSKDEKRVDQVLNEKYDEDTFILIIYENIQSYDNTFFICFNNNLIIINNKDLSKIGFFFMKNPKLKFYMTQETWIMCQKSINISFPFNTINFSENDIFIMKSQFQSSINTIINQISQPNFYLTIK